ncbi:hypothetical protein BATDEDRAFT_25928 [Batrachochytrium dendrobatidis JAM81]|uniref:Zn(2)-C6 fungal-type domain-containing protein n=1 Tax=Batrachochytrium dendrobatidis (strain JAM81 / FGSC 10211) TaxID=684364 RepID=F4P622_BATDJ|nr:uncharacterized protein BATDEDRAFT_25928 [Batrachochytrium dendrobatidis JAM81]EGF79526.1 hypothetical protein BATDEDRAFT_25928 [Batrachochytrium dendrobatidis JAM81]|eukprot:XP_006679913.1 hypothetical protein BATDEDRAFT_25928 [Batrachochytrium dendrobatidis JAM81]
MLTHCLLLESAETENASHSGQSIAENLSGLCPAIDMDSQQHRLPLVPPPSLLHLHSSSPSQQHLQGYTQLGLSHIQYHHQPANVHDINSVQVTPQIQHQFALHQSPAYLSYAINTAQQQNRVSDNLVSTSISPVMSVSTVTEATYNSTTSGELVASSPPRIIERVRANTDSGTCNANSKKIIHSNSVYDQNQYMHTAASMPLQYVYTPSNAVHLSAQSAVLPSQQYYAQQPTQQIMYAPHQNSGFPTSHYAQIGVDFHHQLLQVSPTNIYPYQDAVHHPSQLQQVIPLQLQPHTLLPSSQYQTLIGYPYESMSNGFQAYMPPISIHSVNAYRDAAHQSMMDSTGIYAYENQANSQTLSRKNSRQPSPTPLITPHTDDGVVSKACKPRRKSRASKRLHVSRSDQSVMEKQNAQHCDFQAEQCNERNDINVSAELFEQTPSTNDMIHSTIASPTMSSKSQSDNASFSTTAMKISTSSNSGAEYKLSSTAATSTPLWIDGSTELYAAHLARLKLTEEANKRKRDQVKTACINCRKACKKCSHERPCNRCVIHGIELSCTDVPRKDRIKGPKKNLKQTRAAAMAAQKELNSVAGQSHLLFSNPNQPQRLGIPLVSGSYSPLKQSAKQAHFVDKSHCVSTDIQSVQPFLNMPFPMQIGNQQGTQEMCTQESISYPYDSETMFLTVAKQLGSDSNIPGMNTTNGLVESTPMCFSFTYAPSISMPLSTESNFQPSASSTLQPILQSPRSLLPIQDLVTEHASTSESTVYNKKQHGFISGMAEIPATSSALLSPASRLPHITTELPLISTPKGNGFLAASSRTQLRTSHNDYVDTQSNLSVGASMLNQLSSTHEMTNDWAPSMASRSFQETKDGNDLLPDMITTSMRMSAESISPKGISSPQSSAILYKTPLMYTTQGRLATTTESYCNVPLQASHFTFTDGSQHATMVNSSIV